MEELRQHIIGVGGTDQTLDRQSHLFGIITGEDIAEVSGRDAETDLFAHTDLSFFQQVAVSRDVVNDLRKQTSPVDGICGRKEPAPFRELRGKNRVGKELLHTGLGIVKIPFHSADTDVSALLGLHLQLLHIRNTVPGIKHQDGRSVNILEAFQRRFSGISGGRDQNADLLFFLCFAQ